MTVCFWKRLFAFTTVFLITGVDGRSENVSWTNNASGLFSNPKNWIAGALSANRVPGANDDVSFLSGGLTVTVDGAQATRQLVVSVPLMISVQGSYAVTEVFAQNGFDFSGGGDLSIGIAKSLGGCSFAGLRANIGLLDLPSGSLSSVSADPFRITDGAKVRSEDAKVAGKVIVDNSGEWEHLGDFYDTLAGGTRVPGVLAQISRGGVVRFHRVALAQVEVDAGGRWNGGESDVVYLSVQNGGAASSDRAAIPYGNVVIAGSGSGWAIGSGFTMENSTVTITNGGLFSCGQADIGPSSTVSVLGAGSRFVGGDSIKIRSRMEVLAGGALSGSAIDLGERTGQFGVLFVSGPGSTLVAQQRLFLGDGGTGSFNLAGQARAEVAGLLMGASPGGFGSSTVGDAGTALIVTGALGVGEAGEAMLTVQRGARYQVNAGGAMRLGGLAGGKGTIRISDANTVFDARGLSVQVGNAGAGTLQVQEGGRFLAQRLEAGRSAGSSGVIDMSSVFAAGTALDADQDLVIGLQGSGRLSLNADSNGDVQFSGRSLLVAAGAAPGVVEINGRRSAGVLRENVSVGVEGNGTLSVRQGGRLFIGGNFGLAAARAAEGTVNVEGAGSRIEVTNTSAGLIVGVGGPGYLHLRRGGTVAVPEAAIGAKLGGVITVDDLGSVLTVTSGLFVGGLEYQPALGTLAVSAGGHVQVGRLLCVQRDGIVQLGDATVNIGEPQVPGPRVVRVSNGGTLRGDGLVSGQVIVGLGGRLAPGNPVGKLGLQSSLEVQAGGTLEMEIAGPAPETAYDVVNVAESFTQGGTLLVRFTDGFAPSLGQSFDLVHFGTKTTGSFAKVEIAGLAPGFQHQLTATAGVLRLTAVNSGAAASQPRLNVQRAGGVSTVSWPASASGYQLQSTTNLAVPNWQVVPTTTNAFASPANEAGRFFRLAR